MDNSQSEFFHKKKKKKKKTLKFMESLGKINQVTQYFGTLSRTHVGDMEIQLQCIPWLWQLKDVSGQFHTPDALFWQMGAFAFTG